MQPESYDDETRHWPGPFVPFEFHGAGRERLEILGHPNPEITSQTLVVIGPHVDPPDTPLSFADACSSLFDPRAKEKVVLDVSLNGVEHLRVDADGTVTLYGEVVAHLFSEET